jgi:hypothetical protein
VPITTETLQENANVQYYPSHEPLRLGIENFNRANFGLAERYFQDAPEKAPQQQPVGSRILVRFNKRLRRLVITHARRFEWIAHENGRRGCLSAVLTTLEI